MKRLAIIGSADLARQLAHFAPICGYSVAGFLSDSSSMEDGPEVPPIMGEVGDAETLFAAGSFDELLVGVGYRHMRFRSSIFDHLSARGIPFATLIHPSCAVDRTAVLGRGAVLYPGCIVDQRVRIGDNVLLNLGCIVSHDSEVASHSFLAPGGNIAGRCRIGERCYLGIGATLIDNVSLCDDVQAGGSTLFVRSVREPGLYLGVPAKRREDH